MAEASKDELSKVADTIYSKVFTEQQPGASSQPSQNDNNQNDQNDQNDQNKQLEEMKKLLAQKDAEISALKAKEEAQNDNNNDNNTLGGKDDNESKLPPKTDVTLSLRGIAEYDSYPHAMSADKFYFMASIKAPYFRSDERAPIDLVAVVDESGSMSGDRIKLVKETVQFIIKNLESNDRFGIVGYSSGSRIVLPLTKMDTNGKVSAQKLADSLRASGGTALCAGLVMGVNMMRKRTYKNDVASVMILTDGQANEGPTSAQQINAAVLSGKVSGSSSHRNYQQGPPPPPIMQRKMNRKKLNKKSKKKMQKPIPQQVPQQMQQQVQGQTQGQVQGQKDMIEDEKEGSKKDLKLIHSNELPCTINTFGFGAGHNESLLESIAENGRGMYAFIESTSMIADTFAECLGGLVSIIGQNLKIKVEALNNIVINKCLSDGYTITIPKANKIYQININNLQSEENRDLIFELSVPKLNNNGNEKLNDPIIQLSVDYKNVVKDKQEILSNVCCINRINGKQIGERNIELDVQYNRILAANAMEEADEMANKGKLDEAKKILTNAQNHIKTSKSNQNKFSQALIGDIQVIQNNMQSKQQYRATGSKMMKMNKKAHKMQRSVQSSMYASQSAYQNKSKVKMKKKFKSSK
eukprot:331278_1